jgi:hypothetical protein
MMRFMAELRAMPRQRRLALPIFSGTVEPCGDDFARSVVASRKYLAS